MKEIKAYKYDRIGKLALWLPILLLSAVYIVGMLLDSHPRFSTKWLLIRAVLFVVPFVLLFVVHHYVLLNRQYFLGRIKAYVVSSLLVLSVFGTGCYWLHDFQGHRPEERTPMHNTAKSKEEYRKYENSRDRNLAPGPAPVTMDMILALLLIGADFITSIYLKHAAERQRRDEIEQENLKNELRYLRAQISPHMLMNTLNNIHAMVEIDSAEAQNMLIELSKLMRYAIYEGDPPSTTLACEIDFIESYVALMSKRYSPKRLKVQLDLNVVDSHTISLPPLLFIVIIENAFKHGVSPFGTTNLSISLTLVDGERIKFVCSNSIHHDTATSLKSAEINDYKQSSSIQGVGGGLGLRNLRKRLDLLFGKHYKLDIDSHNNIFTVLLTIPYSYVNENTLPGS